MMDKTYDFTQGAERMAKVPASLIRTIMNRASELQEEGKPVIKALILCGQKSAST